jgi:hypothetical protein
MEVDDVCPHCKVAGCCFPPLRDVVIVDVTVFADSNGAALSNNLLRKKAYRAFVLACYGPQGARNRVDFQNVFSLPFGFSGPTPMVHTWDFAKV